MATQLERIVQRKAIKSAIADKDYLFYIPDGKLRLGEEENLTDRLHGTRPRGRVLLLMKDRGWGRAREPDR